MPDIMDLHWDKVCPEPNSGCWLWTGATLNDRYGYVYYKGKMNTTHRVSWSLVNGPIPPGKLVCHKCDVKLCVNPDHLYAGTHRNNMRDKVVREKQLRGETHPGAKLTDEEAQTIKNDKASKGVDLARKYGVGSATISEIRNGRHWTHLK